ncbi:MAG TPA: hypothetical protein VGM90_05695 [Kofleriaceae bacterium]
MRTIIVSTLVLTGCATAAQSAHTLAPGKTEVTVAGSRNKTTDQSSDDPAIYSGQVMVRTGVSDATDVGFQLSRTTGTSDALWGLTVDPKFRFTEPTAQTTISLGIPVGIFFADEPSISSTSTAPSSGGFDYGGLIVAPTLYVGQQISPTAELLIAPRFYLIKPDTHVYDDTDLRAYFGGSVGVRITDPQRHWAVTPELAFTHINAEGSGDSTTLLTLGLGISVGN